MISAKPTSGPPGVCLEFLNHNFRVARHPTATWSRALPTHLWTLTWSCTVQSRLCGGTTETRLQVRAEG